MLLSTLVGFASYYIVLFIIGVLVNIKAFEVSLIALALLSFLGSGTAVVKEVKFFRQLLSGIAIACATLLVATWFLLPMLAGQGSNWVVILSVFAGLAVFIATRRSAYRRYIRRQDGTQPAPPYGREWCRWMFFILF